MHEQYILKKLVSLREERKKMMEMLSELQDEEAALMKTVMSLRNSQGKLVGEINKVEREIFEKVDSI